MSCLTVHADDRPGDAPTRTEDPAEIAAALAGIGVRFERWSLPGTAALSDDAAYEAILAAYRPHLDRLMGAAAGSADVVRLRPGHPDAAAVRAKFLDEHTHTEDEIRFFVRGAGNFVLHVGGRVYDAHCTANDLIAVPADVPLIVTEGIYLLLDGPWAAVRPLLDEVWFVEGDESIRQERLLARHIAHGRTPAAARAWVASTDEPNAEQIRRFRAGADWIVEAA